MSDSLSLLCLIPLLPTFLIPVQAPTALPHESQSPSWLSIFWFLGAQTWFLPGTYEQLCPSINHWKDLMTRQEQLCSWYFLSYFKVSKVELMIHRKVLLKNKLDTGNEVHDPEIRHFLLMHQEKNMLTKWPKYRKEGDFWKPILWITHKNYIHKLYFNILIKSWASLIMYMI